MSQVSGSPRPMKQICFFVPLNDKDGSPVPEGSVHHIEDCIVLQFGGFTRHAPFRGCWTSPQGVRYEDHVSILEVVTEDCPSLFEQVQAIGNLVLEDFAQQEIFITLRDIETVC